MASDWLVDVSDDRCTTNKYLIYSLQIADKQPLISDRIGLDQIATEYAVEDQIYLSKIKVKTITINNN